MANVLPLSGALTISEIGSLSGTTTGTANTPFNYTELAYTNPSNTVTIDWHSSPSGPIAQNSYSVLPLSSISPSNIWTVGTNVDKKAVLSIYMLSYLDHNLTLWLNINDSRSVNNRPLCYNIAELFEPKSGKRWASSQTSVDLNNYSLSAGDKLYFYLGAGPRTAGAGYYWSNTTIGVSGSQPTYPAPSQIPVKLSEYYHQDYDIPTIQSPIRFSNFIGAVNYLPNTLLSFYKASPTYKTSIVYRASNGRDTVYPYNTIALPELNANSIVRAKRSSNITASNSVSAVSDTYAMIKGVLDVYLACNDGENDGDADDTFMLFLQKNNETVTHITTTYEQTERTISSPRVSDFLSFLNLDDAAPQVIETIGSTSLDSFIFGNPGTQINKWFKVNSSSSFAFKNNTASILNRLVQISNQTNPLVQYSVQFNIRGGLFGYKNRIIVYTKTYAYEASPLCYAIPIGGRWHTESISLEDYKFTFGDVIKIYIGATSVTNASLNLKNTLLLNFP